tara:strand:+ start:163 stop:339 length:177 start_codon:yes stop_codon:yes gene_type:complete
MKSFFLACQAVKPSRKFIKTNALGLPNVNELEEEKRKGQRGRLGDPSSVVHLREVDVL